jgi:hypothetical protein
MACGFRPRLKSLLIGWLACTFAAVLLQFPQHSHCQRYRSASVIFLFYLIEDVQARTPRLGHCLEGNSQGKKGRDQLSSAADPLASGCPDAELCAATAEPQHTRIPIREPFEDGMGLWQRIQTTTCLILDSMALVFPMARLQRLPRRRRALRRVSVRTVTTILRTSLTACRWRRHGHQSSGPCWRSRQGLVR